jgi:apolipoprotein N-acyltransferase
LILGNLFPKKGLGLDFTWSYGIRLTHDSSISSQLSTAQIYLSRKNQDLFGMAWIYLNEYESIFHSFQKRKIMSSILYVIAVILIIGWLLGVFVYSAAGLIHVLLVLAIIALILGFIRRA